MSETQKHTKPNVPNLRFPGCSGEWKKSTLKNECIVNPKTEGLEKEFLYIDLESVVKGQLVKQNIISRDEAPSRAQRVLSKWDIIYQCVRPYQLNNYIIRDDSTIQRVASTGYAQIRTKHNPDFIYQLLHTKGFTDQVINRCTGTNYPAINSSDLSGIEIHFPSIQEQAQIGELLTLIDQRISIQSKVIEKYESLIKALRRHIFSTIESEKEVTIADVLSYEQPTKYIVSDTEYSDNNGLTPVLTANKAFILGYTEEVDGVYDKGPCIILDDFTLDSKIVDFPFKVKSSAIKILSAKEAVSLRYIFEYLKFLNLNTEEHKRHYIAEIEPMTMELPDEATIRSISNLFERADLRREGLERDLHLLEKQKDYLLRALFI